MVGVARRGALQAAEPSTGSAGHRLVVQVGRTWMGRCSGCGKRCRKVKQHGDPAQLERLAVVRPSP